MKSVSKKDNLISHLFNLFEVLVGWIRQAVCHPNTSSTALEIIREHEYHCIWIPTYTYKRQLRAFTEITSTSHLQKKTVTTYILAAECNSMDLKKLTDLLADLLARDNGHDTSPAVCFLDKVVKIWPLIQCAAGWRWRAVAVWEFANVWSRDLMKKRD